MRDDLIEILAENPGGTVNLEEILQSAQRQAGMPADKSAVIRELRRLESEGMGRFYAGRRGHVSRFEKNSKQFEQFEDGEDEMLEPKNSGTPSLPTAYECGACKISLSGEISRQEAEKIIEFVKFSAKIF